MVSPIANPWHHAVSSAKKWGGTPDEYLRIHAWFDESKAHHADFRHRALRHHSEGIFLMESIFGPTLTINTRRFTLNPVGEGPDEFFEIYDERAINEMPVSTWNDPEVAVAELTRLNAKQIPTRWIGEQHVTEDLGHIPAATDWLKHIQAQPWMARSRKLSRELEQAPTN